MMRDVNLLPHSVAQNIHRFTGRTWVLPPLRSWLASDQRIFIIKGAPGTGKSMLLAWLAGYGPPPENAADKRMLGAIRDAVRAVHFCVAATGSVDPRILVNAVARQLTDTLPGFGDALLATAAERVAITAEVKTGDVYGSVTGVHIEHLDLHGLSGEASFNRILRTPLQQLYAYQDPGPLLILIDALDEAATYTGKYHLPYLLSGLQDLPPQVRVLATTRPNTLVAQYLPDPYAGALDLINDAPDLERDVRSYVHKRLTTFSDPERERVADQIAQASEGIFLYAHLVVEETVGCDGQMVQERGALPSGLGGLYQSFLNREIGVERSLWYEHYRPVLGALAVAQGDGLTHRQLVDILGADVEVDRTLDICAPYLIGESPDGPFRPFHQSFVDFMLDRQANSHYWVDAVKTHRAIARHYWNRYQKDWMACDDYGLRYGLLHTALGEAWEMLTRLLADLSFVEAQARRLGLDAILSGLSAVVARLTLPESELEHPDFRERRTCRRQAKHVLRVLDREAHNLRDWNPRLWPAYFAQQVYNRAVYEGIPAVMEAAKRRLAQPGHPHFALNWRTQHEPAALLRSLDVPQLYAMTLARLPDGRLLSGGTDKVLRLWQTDTGALLATLPEHHTQTIRALAVTADGRYALSASFDGTLGLWDLVEERLVTTLVGHQDGLRAVRVTPDDRYAISASKDGTLRVWDLEAALQGDTACTKVLQGHVGAVWDVAVAAQGEGIASVGDDGYLLEWDLHNSSVPIARHKIVETALRSVTFLPGQNQVLAGDTQGRLIRLDLDSGEELALQQAHTSSIFAIAVTNDASQALTASYDRTLNVWGLEDRSLTLTQTLSGHSGRVYDVVLSSDGREAISAAEDGMLKVWQLTTRLVTSKRRQQPKGHQGTVRYLALIPDTAPSLLAISSAQDGTLKVWDVNQGKSLHEYRLTDDLLERSSSARHYEVVAPLDRDTVATAALDRALILRRIADGPAVRTLERRASAGEPVSNEVRDLAVSLDRRRVVSAASDGRLTVWDLDTGEALRTVEGHDDVARVVIFGPDENHLLSGGDDGALKVWDAHAGTLCATLPSPGAGPVRGIELLPQDQVLAGYEAGLLVIWDASDQREVCRMQTQGEGLRGLAVTEGGHHVIVADDKRILRVWDLATLRSDHSRPVDPLALVRLESAPRSMAFSPVTSTLLVGDVVGGVNCLRYVEGDE
jgi:WD40 repeat protein